MNFLEGKFITLGVTGSIASYKSIDLASKLTQLNCKVDVIMTESATRFITPLTFNSITHRPVSIDLFESNSELSMDHVVLAKRSEIIIVYPATANIIAKIAHGFSDDLLTATVLATEAPVVIAPAMDANMYENSATQENINILKNRGITIVGPETGRLASGLVGLGRVVDSEKILGNLNLILGQNGDLKGKKIIVTAGGTKEEIDPVRFISNRSSGKMGYAISQAAINRGAEVTLITASNLLKDIVGVKTIHVSNTNEMFDAVKKESIYSDILIMAAAVSDWTPASYIESKIKKTKKNTWQIDLIKTPDILKSIKKKELIKIGFSAETDDLIVNATKKLKEKELDFIVANDITEENSGFSSDDNKVILIDHHSSPEELPLMSKYEVGNKILDKAVSLL